MMAPTKMKLRMRKKDGPGKASQTVSAEASPDSKCPICLDRFNNMAYLDHCLHKFCFRCIHEWSKNKAECPLCKQPFNSIFHTVKAENDFKEFVLRPAENGSFSSPGAHRLRYGATQTRERRQSPRRTSPPPDNGVIFEGLSGSAPLQQDRGVHRMMMRLAARRRAQSKGRTVRHLREQEMVTFRRALYRTGVRVRSVRDGSRHRDISAAFFQRNPACLHRLLPWLKRELTVLYGTHGSLVNIVQHIIMSRITRYDMEDQAIQDELRPFLLARTDHFLHEFISFARSPFNMEAYDQHAVYDCPAPSYEEGSSSDSSVIAISEDEEDSVERDQRPVSVAGSALSQAPWDDETPGPSYSTTEQTQSPSLSVSESESESSREGAGQPEAAPQEGDPVKADPAANEDGGASSSAEEEEEGEEDCVIVGYVKPMAERTPELVQLSSDSEESVRDGNENPEAPQQPQHIRFPSLSPLTSPCSSPSKHKSPQIEALSAGSFQQADKDLPSLEARERHSPSHKGDSPADRGGTSGVTDISGKYHTGGSRSHDRDERRRRRRSRSRGRSRSRSRDRSRKSGSRRSRSTERSWSARSPTISVHSDSTLSRGRRHSRSRSGERPPSKDRARDKRRERDGGRRRHGRERSSYSYHWDSYSREKESSDPLYVPSRSYCSSLYTSPEYDSRSRSRSPRDPRDLPRPERRRSRSLSGASSQGSRAARRRSRHEKPSGKRKYKTRHLEESSKERPSRAPAPPSPSSGLRERGHHRRSRKKSRSPSVEIIFEGRATAETRRHHKKKKKHRKRSRRHKSRERAGCRSPTVITIDSDTDHTVDITDPPADVGDRAGLVSAENEVSTTTGHPSDAHLLESILQDLEQHILPVDQDSSSAGASHTDAASSQVAFDIDKCNTPFENKHSPVSSDDETSTGSPLITIESQFIEQNSLEDAPDISAVSRTD